MLSVQTISCLKAEHSKILKQFQQFEKETPNYVHPQYSTEQWKQARQDCLEWLQLRGMKRASATETVNQAQDILNTLNVECSSPFRTPYEYWLLVRNQILIENAAKSLGHKNIVRPLIDALPIGAVDARVFYIPSDEYVVIVQSGLKVFTNLLCKAVVSIDVVLSEYAQDVSPTTELSVYEALIRANPEPILRFRELLLAYLFKGHPAASGSYKLKDRAHQMANLIEMSMDLFAMGHEYGHVFNRHFHKNERPYHRELEADSSGLELMIKATESAIPDHVLSSRGVALLCTSLDIVQRAVDLVKHGTEQVPSKAHDLDQYPPWSVRREELLRKLGSLLDVEQLQIAVAMAASDQHFMEFLFAEVAPELKQCHKQKIALHPMWNTK